MAFELDRAAIMDQFMDDEELLFESMDLFFDNITQRMADLNKAVADKDPEAFMPIAHTIKGMVGYFSTAGAYESAKKLELKGREKTTDGVDEDLAALTKDMDELVAAMKEWRSEG